MTKNVVVLALLILVATTWSNRVVLMLAITGFIGGPPALNEKSEEPQHVKWFDNYFTLEYIDEKTIAIGEPRYWQVNYNYLILGDERAILFDSGPGLKDIKPVIASLTDLPVTVVASHLHYDHVGNHDRFASIAMLDVPSTRARATENGFKISSMQHLGFLENIKNPVLNVSEWWQPNTHIDLGGRTLKILNAPGHTPDSLILWDEQSDLLFAGDYIYDGLLYAMLPGSDLDDYEQTAARLLSIINDTTRLLTAHRESTSGAPILARDDLLDLHQALQKINRGDLKGEGWFSKTYKINQRLSLASDQY